MILSFFRKSPRLKLIETLYARIAAASRNPALYGEHGIADTLEGRFESLILHAILVLRRLKALPDPAKDAAQDLVDEVFCQLDLALREMGVGDVAVPKRMKTMAEAFYGRAATYDSAIAAGRGALIEALKRNIDSGDDALAGYVLDAVRRLEDYDLDRILGQELPFQSLPWDASPIPADSGNPI